MYCAMCGNALQDTARFCMNCGAARPILEQTAPSHRVVQVTSPTLKDRTEVYHRVATTTLIGAMLVVE